MTGRRLKRTVLLLITCLALLAAAAPTSSAAPSDYFRAAGCSIRYVAPTEGTIAKFKLRRLRAALDRWRFRVGYRMMSVPPSRDFSRAPTRSYVGKLNNLSYLDQLLSIHLGNYHPKAKGAFKRVFSRADRRRALRHAIALASGWVSSKTVPPRAWQRRLTGLRAPYLAFVARRGACLGMLGESRARALRRSLREHARVLGRRPKHSLPENHQLGINTGMAMLAYYLRNDPKVRRAGAKASQRFIRAIRNGMDRREGVWLEHSPRYQRHAADLLDAWLREIRPRDRRVRRLRASLRRTLGHFLLPNDALVAFGDTSGERLFDSRVLQARRSGWWVARRSGFAVHSDPARSRWFGLSAGYHGHSHKQSDELTFDLYDSGRKVITDTGFFHADRDRWLRYQNSSRAHSVLTVDGQDFPWRDHRPYGSGIRATGSGDGWFAVRATNPLLIAPKKLTAAQRRRPAPIRRKLRRRLRTLAAHNASHRRFFAYKPGQMLVVADRIRSKTGTPHVYRRHFHFGPVIDVQEQSPEELLLTAAGNDEAVGRVLSSGDAGSAALSLNRGVTGSRPQGFLFPVTGVKVERTVAIWELEAENTDQLTVFVLGSQGGEIAAAEIDGELGNGARIRFSDASGDPVSSLEIQAAGNGSLRVSESG